MSITILLADDHKLVRDGLRAILEGQADLAVIGAAADGREAVRQASQRCPDVVVMDLTMPQLNGIEAGHQIHEICPDTQVIILSMHANPEFVLRALQAGARGYILKETAGVEVVDAIRTVHAGQRYLSPKISDILLNDYIDLRAAADTQDPLTRLSAREREVLQFLVEGKTNEQIADLLALSPNTVHTYRGRIMQKLAIDNLPDLVKFALRYGLISLE